jgi:hypothetical protein
VRDAGHRSSRGNIDPAYAAMGNLASDEDGVQQAWKREVGDELPASGQKAEILTALHCASDKAR